MSIRAARLVLGAIVMLGGPAAAQSILDLSIPEARALAERAALAGEPEVARDIAKALVEANEADRDALIVLAAVEPGLGNPTIGRRAASRAWALSDTALERYEAARLAAAAAAVEERYLLAGAWLRIALATAPDEAEEARTLEDARRVAGLSPWRFDVELSFSPSDNVNGGSESPFNVIDGLPFVGVISVDGRALSGWVLTGDATATRRLSESERQRTELSVRLGGRAVALSSEARDLIESGTRPGEPLLTGSDFSSAYAELRLGHDRVVGSALVGGDLSVGTAWDGGERSQANLRAEGRAAFRVGGDQSLRLTGWADQLWDEEGSRGDVRVGAQAAWTFPAFGPDRATLALSRSETLSDNGNAASRSWGLRASYDLGRPVGPAWLGASLGATWTDYPDYAVLFPVPGGRQDERLSATLSATFDDWGYAGFVPVVTLEASRTDSNVSRFASESVGVGFAVRSSF